MKKITLPYTPERDLEQGIRVEITETSNVYMAITKDKVDYELPDRTIMGVYAYVPIDVEEVEEE